MGLLCAEYYDIDISECSSKKAFANGNLIFQFILDLFRSCTEEIRYFSVCHLQIFFVSSSRVFFAIDLEKCSAHETRERENVNLRFFCVYFHSASDTWGRSGSGECLGRKNASLSRLFLGVLLPTGSFSVKDGTNEYKCLIPCFKFLKSNFRSLIKFSL